MAHSQPAGILVRAPACEPLSGLGETNYVL